MRAVVLEVLSVVHVVSESVGWVLPRIEKKRTMLDIVLFVVFTEGALFLFDEILMVCSRLHVSVLKSTLIWAPSSVCWRDFIVEPRREVVHLQVEV